MLVNKWEITPVLVTNSLMDEYELCLALCRMCMCSHYYLTSLLSHFV